MLKLNHVSLCVVALLPLAAIAQTPMPSAARTETVEHHAEVAAIEHVMKQFHDAVVAHDGAALSGLFLPDANIWLNVLTDAAFDGAQDKAPNTARFASAVIATSRSLFRRRPRLSTRNTATSSSTRMEPSRPSISILFSRSMGKTKTTAARPGSWSKRSMAGRSRRSRIHQIQPHRNSDWKLELSTSNNSEHR